jgi:hypothetical protein
MNWNSKHEHNTNHSHRGGEMNLTLGLLFWILQRKGNHRIYLASSCRAKNGQKRGETKEESDRPTQNAVEGAKKQRKLTKAESTTDIHTEERRTAGEAADSTDERRTRSRSTRE